MPTQENVKPLILDKEVGNRRNEIAMLEKRIAENRKVISDIPMFLSETKKAKLIKMGEYSRDAGTVKLSFFQTNHNTEYVVDVIDTIIAKQMVAMQMSGKSEVSDGPRSYEHYKTVDVWTSDIEIIHEFNVSELSSLDEILVNAYYMIMDDLHGIGTLVAIAEDNQENLNLGYCELTDETGPHIYVVYLERMGKKDDGRMHYHLHYTKIPRTYKANRHFLVKKS
jgi:hypothetical protein